MNVATEEFYIELLITVALFALIDCLTPFNLRNSAFLFTQKQPFSRALSVSLGYSAAYIAGAPLIYGIRVYLTEHYFIDSLITFLAGCILIRLGIAAWRMAAIMDEPLVPVAGRFRLLLFGFSVKLLSMPLAIPFVIAVDEVRAAQLPVLEMGVFLLAYLWFYLAPIQIMGCIRLFSEKTNEKFYESIQSSVAVLNRYYGTLVLIGFGALFILYSTLFTLYRFL